MIYPQPDTLIQTRPDVLTMTPWFAPIVWQGTYNRDILNEQFKLRNVTVGLTVFAIKKYVVFLQVFLETAEKFFMVGHNVNYYVFTDHPDQVPNITLAPGRQIITLLVPAHKRWQEVTMRRMDMLHNASRAAFISQVDYIVAVDVDMQFSDVVGVEILGDLFGTLHPGLYRGLRQQFTYERRPASQAYIPLDEGDFYYAGGFFGGTVREVYKLTGYCHKAMMMDKQKGIEAVWHDESYLNKYFVGKKTSKILSPEYLWDNNMGSQTILTNKRFMAVAKNHTAIRNKYVVFLQLFVETAEKFFMVGHNVNYYVFTDHPDQVPNITLGPGRQIITLLVPAHKRWQEVSMRRMEMLHNASRDAFINQVDYIVAVDVDMQFSDVVGVEILGDLFGTLHPGLYRGLRQQFTYERRPASQAYIPLDEGDFYYAGGFFGGTVREVYKLTGYCHKAMMMDKEKGIEAVWHDESHLNKYFVGKKPSKILSPEYLWDNNMWSPAILRNKRFIAVPKNHAAIRNK